MSTDLFFTTAVSGETRTGLELRGVPLKKLIAEADFISTLYLSLTGKHPSSDARKLLNAILVAALDPGLEPATGFVPRVVISSGADVTTAVATSMLVLGPRHGGAVTAAMQLFSQVMEQSEQTELAVRQTVTEYRKNKQRLPGFGHPKGKQSDERAHALFLVARRSQMSLAALDVALNFETALEEQTGRHLPLNIDGAMAAVLLALGIDPLAGNALYAVARAAGAIAHCVEEARQGNSVRRLRSDQIEYIA